MGQFNYAFCCLVRKMPSATSHHHFLWQERDLMYLFGMQNPTTKASSSSLADLQLLYTTHPAACCPRTAFWSPQQHRTASASFIGFSSPSTSFFILPLLFPLETKCLLGCTLFFWVSHNYFIKF
ncbi:hypothetical protein PHAVU_006G167000 [Phaseolus vulgaris]|uniref:Uncharacterized protein n=1 Tax=Phaseolus vulgaris TaxID=3885 RepID=V7BPN1_PHAVU|nr:hypothetical protein PHAVU_006G167000g [Phaseolus vulgaris]ESW19927.1 hypothetical protein PHAVU_006G167000g [Phaseolus vulgaris]